MTAYQFHNLLAMKERIIRKVEREELPVKEGAELLGMSRQGLLKLRKQYLVCIRMPSIPMTNNKAERSLRHLVIKRLISFGSRTQKGAQAMETLLSVLLTLWWSKPSDYFAELRKLIPA